MNADLTYALRLLGHLVGSHVLARATLAGRTGRYEETLTADLVDMFSIYGPACDDYLVAGNSPARLSVVAKDLHKKAESEMGADFGLVLRGIDYSQRPATRTEKFLLVQAKRQDFPGARRYADSDNHVAKAKAMRKARGSLSDCFFAFYHSKAALGSMRTPRPWPTPSRLPPTTPGALLVTTMGAPQGSYLGPFGFIERSGYRGIATSHLPRSGRSALAPDNWSWGAGILSADYFVKTNGAKKRGAMPTIKHVGTNGKPLCEWLTDLGSCTAGTNVSSSDLAALVKKVCAVDIEDDGAFTPSAIIEIRFASGGPPGETDLPPTAIGDIGCPIGEVDSDEQDQTD